MESLTGGPATRVTRPALRCMSARGVTMTVKNPDKRYMAEPLRRHPLPATPAIGVDEIAIRKGQEYRIGVSDLMRQRPIGFGGPGRKQTDLEPFFAAYGARRGKGVQGGGDGHGEAVSPSDAHEAPQAEMVFDKFPILRHLNHALDAVRRGIGLARIRTHIALGNLAYNMCRLVQLRVTARRSG